MRAMPIRVVSGYSGWMQMRASFRKNWKHYLQEALGLAIFMISACFFGAILESDESMIHRAIQEADQRHIITALLMGATALLIFYSPLTAPSGSQINPAVTITFLRLGKMCKWDSLFYIIFQVIGGTAAVFLMQQLMGSKLTASPVYSAITVPGQAGPLAAAFMEFAIGFITMMLLLLSSEHEYWKKYTRFIAACLVAAWVLLAGPVSGFGMNPARSFASAYPAGIWTSFWIYLFVPIAAMLLAAEIFLLRQKSGNKARPRAS